MHLESVEAWHWRGLEHALLEDFSERLNLIHGRNEAGKSRLLQALTFGLFESFKGQPQYKRELQGWSSAESPRVAVVFHQDGIRYRVEKQFLKGGYALLEGAGRTLKDEDAEEELRRLLGTRAGGSGRSADPKDYGLWPLLWLTQGASRRAPHEDLNEEPRATLQDRLAAQVGEVAGGPLGQRILERARQESARFWTAKSGRSTGELAAAETAHETARARCEEAVARREAVHALSDRLQQRRAEAADLRRRLDQRRQEHRELTQRVEALGRLKTRVEEQRREVEASQGRLTLVRERLETRRREEARRRRREEEVGALAVEMTRVDESLAQAEQAAAAARAAVEEAETALIAAQESERRIEAVANARRLDEEIESVAAALAAARRQHERVAELRRERAALAIDPARVTALARREEELLKARARLEGAAARLRIHALRDLRLDGEALPAGADHTLLIPEARTLVLEGVARLEVDPGAGEGRNLADRVRDLEAEQRRDLESLGLEDLAAARRRLEAVQALDAQLRAETKSGEGTAGAEELEARHRALAAAREALPPLSSSPAADGPELDAGAAREAVRKADEARTRARALREAAAKPVEELRQRRATLQGRRDALDLETERIAGDDAGPAEQELEAAVLAQEARHGEALRRLEDLEEEFLGAGGAALEERWQRLGRSLEGLEEEHRGLRDEVLRLEVELETAGSEGLHELTQEREQALAEAAATLARLTARATAARHLLEILETERRAAQKRLTEPVRRHLAPYLGQLFPGSELALDEDWTVGGLTTGDTHEGFDQLSAGAQEQLGVLVRIALGEILASDGRLPLILDDALVHSDPARRRALLGVLDRASRHLQVLVFTSHDESFDELGPQRRYRLTGGRGDAGADRSVPALPGSGGGEI